MKKVASARVELAYCYWREGALDEARILLNEALERLTTEGNTRANALLGLAIVEWSASRHGSALKILTENAPLYKKITNNAIKGTYHNQLAIVLRNLATPETRDEYFHSAISEYKKADHYFKLARNTVFQADVREQVGFYCSELQRFKEAHKYLGRGYGA